MNSLNIIFIKAGPILVLLMLTVLFINFYLPILFTGATFNSDFIKITKSNLLLNFKKII